MSSSATGQCVGFGPKSGFGPANEYATDQKRYCLVRKQSLHISRGKALWPSFSALSSQVAFSCTHRNLTHTIPNAGGGAEYSSLSGRLQTMPDSLRYPEHGGRFKSRKGLREKFSDSVNSKDPSTPNRLISLQLSLPVHHWIDKLRGAKTSLSRR